MTLVLQIVKHSDAGAWGKNRRRESGVQKHVEPVAQRLDRQHRLLPQNSRRAKAGAHGLRDPVKIRLAGNQIAPHVSRLVKTKYSLSRSMHASAISNRRR